ncbi:MAG: M15 family metallopeptidase [Trueperaceae bacterium]
MGLTLTTRLLLLAGALLPIGFASPPPCQYADQPALLAASDDWSTALVDTAFRLPADYVPADLVPVRRAGLADDRTLRAAVVADLGDLLAAAREDGLSFELQSAYRSFDYQERVFAGWIETLGRERALRTSARPGHSEHQLGTALDLRSPGGPSPWELADWALTAEGGWLQENGWLYGFVMSYPKGKEALTCYAYEPWHYRWVGRERAMHVHESALSLREWLWRELDVEAGVR